MSHDDTQQSNESPDSGASDPVAALLKKALAQPPQAEIRFLPAVQERIRLRTRGRYFGRRRQVFRDPFVFLLAAALLILLIGAMVYVVIEPLMAPSLEPALPPPPQTQP